MPHLACFISEKAKTRGHRANINAGSKEEDTEDHQDFIPLGKTLIRDASDEEETDVENLPAPAQREVEASELIYQNQTGELSE